MSKPGISLQNLPAAVRLCRRMARFVPALCYRGSEIRLHSLQLAFAATGQTIKSHQHGFYEGIWMLRGRGEALCAPRCKLRAGMMRLHPPHTRHAWRAVTDVWRLGAWFDLAPAPPLADGVTAGWRPCRLDDVTELLTEADSDPGGRRERLAARLLLMLARMLECLDWPAATEAAAPEDAPAPGIADLVDRFLADNLAQPLTLNDVAQQMNMSVPGLTAHMRRETGASVMRRLHAMRMREAARLLENTNASVKEIAARTGLPEPSYFCRCFRAAFGCSPMQWRVTRA